jgi:acetyl esterase/lipase
LTGVPLGYLVAVALAAAGTLFAVMPLRRPWARGGMSFFLGPFVNELPFVVFGWLLLSTVLAITDGDLEKPGGWVAFGVAIGVMIGLGVVVWRGLKARPAVDRSLAEALGSGWRADLDHVPGDPVRRKLPFARILFAPFLVRRRDVRRIADISYGDAGRANQLDVYRHRLHVSGAPILIHLHGGHFAGGGKDREARPLLYRFASRGWLCVSANYRLRPAADFRDQLIDVKKVIAWVREHTPEYGGDPTRVLVAGSSAGAHLAAAAALTPGDPRFQPGFEGADTSVTAAIGLYGYYGDAAGGVPSSLLAHVGPDAPPFFVAHGDRDTTAPAKGARDFVQGLRSVSSSPVVYAELPGGQHTFDLFHSIRFETVINGIEAFTAWVSSPRAPNLDAQDPGVDGRHREDPHILPVTW